MREEDPLLGACERREETDGRLAVFWA